MVQEARSQLYLQMIFVILGVLIACGDAGLIHLPWLSTLLGGVPAQLFVLFLFLGGIGAPAGLPVLAYQHRLPWRRWLPVFLVMLALAVVQLGAFALLMR